MDDAPDSFNWNVAPIAIHMWEQGHMQMCPQTNI